MSFWGQVKLMFQIYTDLNVVGQFSLLAYGTVPVLLQSICLSRFGHKFDYIVAGKPQAPAAKTTNNKNDVSSDTASVSTKLGDFSLTGSAVGSDAESNV
jgi:hypothetical protein